jgi:hypothetical protein
MRDSHHRFTLIVSRLVLLALIAAGLPLAAAYARVRQLAVLWEKGPVEGQFEVTDGTVLSGRFTQGAGTISGTRFSADSSAPVRLELAVNGSETDYGPGRTIVTVRTPKTPFSFFLDNVDVGNPIYIREYGVMVTGQADPRSYDEIRRAIEKKGLPTGLQRIENEPEETYEEAIRNVRQMKGETWLGLGRDMRIFAVGERLDWIHPRFHGERVKIPELGDQPVTCNFAMGRGWGAVENISRRLEDGVLPILHGQLVDGDITYHLTTFVSLERSPLTSGTVTGTPYLVADGHAIGHMFTGEQERAFEAELPAEMNRGEETVLYLAIQAVNTARVPRYAWFRAAWPSADRSITPWHGASAYSLEPATGFVVFPNGRVFAGMKLNGKPMAQQEVALLLRPGETASYQLFLPHRPVTPDRAARLAVNSLEQRLQECRAYWRGKLATAARVHLPEARYEEMMKAGLLHLDLVAYGKEPDGPIAATIGVYAPIGSESSPIIQYMDSMGWHREARRALMYFLEKQHENGFIQNFGNYMLETGAALWTMGEHYRYTGDDDWVRQIRPKLLKSAEFILEWRRRNLREDLRGKGYGMIEGKTADPNDPYRSFMLNGYHYLGLQRVAEMLQNVDPAESKRLAAEAQAFREDIRQGFLDAMSRSPVVPLGDGTWVPSMPPWMEYRGPVCLYADGGQWFTHGTFMGRDSLLGPLYAVFQEVIDPNSPEATFTLAVHNELMTERNTAFSQPYYSRHPIINLKRGEVKAFIKAYYDTSASLADRETYSFWEHYFQASPHKTHEEAWFLMDSRWRLYMEEGTTLTLLPGIPRSYLENGKVIEVDGMRSYFGPIHFRVQSDLDQRRIVASIECRSDRGPRQVKYRLPHPEGRKAISVEGGRYLPEEEAVLIENFSGQAKIQLSF